MGTYDTVLVGTDGSDSSYRAVDRAAEMARDEQATLVVVCAYYPASRAEVADAHDQLGDIAYQVVGSNPAEETLRTASERASQRGAKDIVTEAIRGDPAKSVVDAIDKHGADLVVIGNRGLNSIAGRILGSVPANVSRQARTDVLIVHTTGR